MDIVLYSPAMDTLHAWGLPARNEGICNLEAQSGLNFCPFEPGVPLTAEECLPALCS